MAEFYLNHVLALSGTEASVKIVVLSRIELTTSALPVLNSRCTVRGRLLYHSSTRATINNVLIYLLKYCIDIQAIQKHCGVGFLRLVRVQLISNYSTLLYYVTPQDNYCIVQLH